MVVDIHALLEKNPVTKVMLKPKFGYKYLAEEVTNKSIESRELKKVLTKVLKASPINHLVSSFIFYFLSKL